MSMFFDYSGEEIFNTEAPLNEELEQFVLQILAWKKAGHMLQPEDVLNMLVEYKVMPSFNVKQCLGKPVPAATLPTSFIDVDGRLN